MANQSTNATLASYTDTIKNHWDSFIDTIKSDIDEKVLTQLTTYFELSQLNSTRQQTKWQEYKWGIGRDTFNFGLKKEADNHDLYINALFSTELSSTTVSSSIIWIFFLSQLYQQISQSNTLIKNLLQTEMIKSMQIVMTFLKEESKSNNINDKKKQLVAMLLSVELVNVHVFERQELTHTTGVQNTHTIPAAYLRTNKPLQAGCLLNWVTLNEAIFSDFVTILTQLTWEHITQEMLFIALAGEQTRKKISWIEEATLPQNPVEQLAIFMEKTPENNHNSHLKYFENYTLPHFWNYFIAPLTTSKDTRTYHALLSVLIGTYCTKNNTKNPEEHHLIRFLKNSEFFYYLAAKYFSYNHDPLLAITSNDFQTQNGDLRDRLSCLIYATTITNKKMQSLLVDFDLGDDKDNKEWLVNYILSIPDNNKKLYYIDLALGKRDKKHHLFIFLQIARGWTPPTEWTKGSSLNKLATARRHLTGNAIVHEIRTVNNTFDPYDSPDARMIHETLHDLIQKNNAGITLDANDNAISNIKWWIGPQNKHIPLDSKTIGLSHFFIAINHNKKVAISSNTLNYTIYKDFIKTFYALYRYQIEVLQEKYQSSLSTTLKELRCKMIEQMTAFLTTLNNQLPILMNNTDHFIKITGVKYILIILNMELINDDPEDGIYYLPASSIISWVTADEALYQAFITLVKTLGKDDRTWEMFINALEGRQERNILEKDETDRAQQAILPSEQAELTTRMQTLYPLIAETMIGDISKNIVETDEGTMTKMSRELYHASTLRNPAASVDEIYKKIQCLPLEERAVFLEYLLFKKEGASELDSLLHFLIINHDEHYVRHFAAEYLITQKLLDPTTSTLKLTEDKTQGILPEMLELINSQATMGPQQLTSAQKNKMASWWNTYKKELRKTIQAIPNLTDRIIFQRRMLTEGTPLYTFLKHQRTWFPDLGLTSQFSIAQRDEANTRKLLAIWFFAQYEKNLKTDVQHILKDEAIRLIKKGEAKEDFSEHIFHLEDNEKEKYLKEAIQDNSTLNTIFTTQRSRILPLPVTPTRGVFGNIHRVARLMGVGIYKDRQNNSPKSEKNVEKNNASTL